MANCNSCGIPITGEGGTAFPCPSCAASTVGRCKKCRDQGVAYVCPDCGFRGP